jgi:peptidoglycan/xylan/chitin deacetylase (PgdA/CDA1 family)
VLGGMRMKHGPSPGFGALVISLDFELRWGLRDVLPLDGGSYRQNLLGARAAIPRLFDLFEEFEIAATWATVGFLFASTREELELHHPRTLPNYADASLDPYADTLGQGEDDDPLHYAGSLVDQIGRRPRQEIGSHTYSHYYCLEPGHDLASFRNDIQSAVAIARKHGVQTRSLVFPRNQFNPDYAGVLAEAGFTCCRTNAAGWIYRESAGSRYRRADARAGRLLDSYVEVSGDQVTPWGEIPFAGSLCCLPASHFLRPYTPRLGRLEPLRLRRITSGLRRAASEHGVFHLWWHPHNAGVFTDEYLAFLRGIFEEYRRCRDRFGMQSLSMADAAEVASSLPIRQAA